MNRVIVVLRYRTYNGMPYYIFTAYINQSTASSYDSGLIISSGNGRYFCIWFEDQD